MGRFKPVNNPCARITTTIPQIPATRRTMRAIGHPPKPLESKLIAKLREKTTVSCDAKGNTNDSEDKLEERKNVKHCVVLKMDLTMGD
jgi:hypothetical protein